ncbi:MAG: YebC/PmpR family DNA-binding transcriptional regulator [Nitrospiraceae bacterium]|nr:YebC/PmpR family DNA-binding transcriptional regulator [Nitrospiraceae bacterium]MDA8090818.1 YebC/PmpR family DNA-binding transcriptional regulator [Nitrospiraceae bacterium]
MSGHSKWAQIKHKKAATDVKKGKVFSKLAKEISVAARLGGGDPGGNPRLKTVMEKAKEVNMPAENIKRAIQKGTGELPGASYEEMIYEGYGPGGAAILINTLSDNKNRTVSELRHLMSKNGGALGETGCVAWIFDKKGYILVDKKTVDEDALMSVALDAGALDMKNDPKEDNYEIITAPEDLNTVVKALKDTSVDAALAEVTMLPKNYVMLDPRQGEQMTRLMEALEDHDDVQNVYSNFDIPEEVLEKSS